MSSGKNGRQFAPGTVRRIIDFARGYGRRLSLFVLLSVIAAVLAVATPVLAGKVIDAIVAEGPLSTVRNLALLIAAVAIAEAGVSLWNRWLSSSLGEQVIYDLRTTVYEHVQKMPIAFFTRTRTGALVSRLNNDVIGAQQAFAGTLSGVVSNIVALILTAGVMVSYSWQLTVLSVLMLPIFLIPARRMGATVARLRREAAEYNADMGTQMTERFSAPGATLVKLFGDPDAEAEAFAARTARVRDVGVKIAMRQFFFVTSLTLVAALALALVYGLGGAFALAGKLQAGDIVTLALLLTRLYAPLTGLANARVEVMSALVSFDRVFEILDLKPLLTEKPEATDVPAGPVSVRFRDVRFGYPSADQVSLASLEDVTVLDNRGGQEVLQGIDFEVPAGQTYALVGSSGAGKSTIAQLLARLYDVDQGSVEFSGLDVRDARFASLRDTVGMVTQDGHLFHDTIAANLRMANPEASDDALWDALRRARLNELIRSLPDGLDTMVGERGYRLSGGERQRLTIARLLLGAPRVVLLDEATAALDSTSEAAVQAALGEALAGRTAVVIAHRLSTIRTADAILVVEDGRIVERGSHIELLAAGGRYAELYRTQFAPAGPAAATDG
ncbi:ABC transporter ATP-binding protein [Arthrobacter rhombi]|uniref:Lipid A export ATP-binding/permease protein MsbA n=1 Tax=Arthrobacter rhombi TaxID=71253 RepID=A0A1R4FI51_9MICC|nr:ABC transporter ATP-binding protein [Arthrobacter rhombi]SJM55670.1 Lipid A export ATP-binding/permease protein MsbA [Arthrobacter rhombi]